MARVYSITPPTLGSMTAEQVDDVLSDAAALEIIKRG